MKERNTTSEKVNIVFTVIMLGILIFFLGTVLLCLGEKFFGNPDEGTQQGGNEVAIDWEKEYPFTPTKEAVKVESSFFDKVKNRLGVFQNYISANLFKKNELVYAANSLENCIGWEADYAGAYNPVFRLEDNYLVKMQNQIGDLSKNEETTAGLKTFCEEKNIGFSYISLPFKVSKYTDKEYDEKYTFVNKAADELLVLFDENNVDYLDIREKIKASKEEHHSLFYETDHHWKVETALRSAGYVAEYLNETYDCKLDKEVFNIDNYKSEVYEEHFLGSLGKKWTTAKVKPDDFTLLYPEFDTELTLEIPSLGIEETGDFSVCYNMDNMVRDYNDINSYATYLYGDYPVVRLRNENASEDKKILIIKDSYVNAMAPFLSLAVSDVDLLDLRHFNGSVETYIEKENPDIVLVAYNVESIGVWQENWIYDFR